MKTEILHRLHNSSTEQLDLTRIYEEINGGPCNKPRGLWYALDNTWYKIAYDDDHIFEHNHFLELDLTSIFIVEDSRDLMKLDSIISIYKANYPDWTKLLNKGYKGVEFRNFEFITFDYRVYWFSALDCSSGCIWDLSCIKEVKTVIKNHHEQERIHI